MGNYTRIAGESFIGWANRVNCQPNKNRVHCLFDGAVLEAGQGKAICLPEAGIEPRYICSDCFDILNDEKPYHWNACNRIADSAALGTIKKGLIERNTIGLEIEHIASRYDEKAFYSFKVLVERCFNVTEESDGTVEGEFPTDKMNGGNKASKMIRKFEKYGFLVFLDDESVGAHIHVACTCIGNVRNWYNTLFVPLSDYLTSHSNEWLREKFGRGFGSYRNPITRSSDCMSHSNFVNCQHTHTLEFRLPRIRSAEQYITDIYFFREVVALLNNTEWIAKTSDNRNERKAQAVNLSREIVEIAKDYFGA